MFEVETIQSVMIITPDTLRMNPEREQMIYEFTNNKIGVECSAYIANINNANSIMLFGGDDSQRKLFMDELTKAIWR